jgi:hypothetical protein
MSIQAFKRKGVIQYGSGRSGNKGYGDWIRQGPFGSTDSVVGYGAGFSLNGGTRNVGYVGKTYAFSKQGTPFVGQFAKGNGGCCGTYYQAEPFFNATEAIVLGNQGAFIKPSVLSTKGMLEKKYRWINTGKYPNYWVQPNYTGNQTDSASSMLYTQNKAAANDCVVNTNTPQIYENYQIIGAPLGCSKSTTGAPLGCSRTMARLKFVTVTSNANYTKELYIPQTSSQHTLRIQRRCQNPIGPQKPFPFRVPGNANTNAGAGINYTPPPILTPVYFSPPAWYTATPSSN